MSDIPDSVVRTHTRSDGAVRTAGPVAPQHALTAPSRRRHDAGPGSGTVARGALTVLPEQPAGCTWRRSALHEPSRSVGRVPGRA